MNSPKNKPRAARQENPTPIKETYRVSSGEKASETLIEEIMTKSGRSRTAAKKLISSGCVSLSGKTEKHPESSVKAGDLVTVHAGAKSAPFTHPLIFPVWESPDYLVLRKEAGIRTVNTGRSDREETVLWKVSEHYKKDHPDAKFFMVSRLDRETAGFVILAKSVEAKEALVRQWSQLVREQTFIAAVEGELPALHDGQATLTSTSKGSASGDKGKKKGERNDQEAKKSKRTETTLTRLKSGKAQRMHVVEVSPHSVRVYSLRKILSDNGLIVVGDGRYRSSFSLKGKIALEQVRLVLTFPGMKEPLVFERHFPSHFYTYLKEDKPLQDTLKLKRNNN